MGLFMPPADVGGSRSDILLGRALCRCMSMGWLLLCGLVVALAPLTLLIWNRDWFFTPIGYIDPWYYVGFAHYYANSHFLPGAYKLARLPWVLSGWLAYHLFPPLTAAYVLHGSYLVLSVGAMFATAYLAFNDLLVALTAALLLGFLPPFQGSGGWDYNNTPAGAFDLVTTALLQWAIVAPAWRGRAMALCGAAFALTVHCNITFINFLPVLLVHYSASIWYAERRARGRATYLWPWLYGIAGAVGITAVLCAINAAVGRGPWFFLPLVKIVLRYTSEPKFQAVWWRPWSDWLLNSEFAYCALPFAIVIAGGVALARKSLPLSLQRVTAVLFIGEGIFLVLLWAAWQAQGQTALNIDYFAYPLFVPSILSVASIMFLGTRPLSRRVAIMLAFIAYCLLVFGLIFGWHYRLAQFFPAATKAWLLVPMVLILAALVLHRIFRGGLLGWLAFFVFFSVANATIPANSSDLLAGHAEAQCHLRAVLDETIINAMTTIAAVDPSFAKQHIWFDEKENMTPLPDCQISMSNLGYSIEGSGGWPYLAGAFPVPPINGIPEPDLLANARAQSVLVVPTDNPKTIEALKSRLEAVGGTVTTLERHAVGAGPIKLDLYVLHLGMR